MVNRTNYSDYIFYINIKFYIGELAYKYILLYQIYIKRNIQATNFCEDISGLYTIQYYCIKIFIIFFHSSMYYKTSFRYQQVIISRKFPR